MQQNVSLTGLTAYSYIASACPEDGQYTISNAVDGTCFSSFWHALSEDHTPGDVTGKLMIVNGAFEAGEFYKQPIAAGLCPGTSYELSLWAVNLIKPGVCQNSVLPNLTIRVETEDGTILKSIDLGTIIETPTPVWNQYATVFTAPLTDERVVIKLLNQEGGCGNDLAIDDIQLRQCSSCMPDPVYVPDVFTPNNDGVNDALTVFFQDVASFSLKIYNRWGSLIFASTDPENKWDGTFNGSPCATGDYAWVLSYKSARSVGTENDYVRTGRVRLIR
ncbi:gliding motility-associated C-terminal domain-containing protein [Spirosoma sp. BT702]|uniref:Gliding motility-associated C-terminal domain-containing protein n=1 Tax=Spirosoma profusum TaxID=2771354 RepID=A0A926Y1I2_9BACT|nr:gliding motility-associated C-terminal domain-containing protein [Spirosoma profusum]MBD2704311.1 gliding motility-associated C-terminal domain-containing protein [Spirosoma profusum]